MQTILNSTPFRIFPTREAALSVARDAQTADPSDVYTVTETDRGFVVAIYDEDGFFVGNHP